MSYNLTIIEKDARTTRHAITQEDILLGSDPACTLVLNGHGVGRRHIRLVLRDSKLILVPLDRENGVTVNGRAIVSPWVLAPRTRVKLGEVELEIDPPVRKHDPNALLKLVYARPANTRHGRAVRRTS